LPGIIHGDIKTDNVLVFEDEAGTLTAKMIDFGYSCFGTSLADLVTVPRTKGWCAPEHKPREPVKWTDAQKMDLFSFGLLVCRLILWEELISGAESEGLLFTEEDGDNLAARVDDMVDKLKGNGRFLELALSVLDTSSNITGPENELLRKLFALTLDPDPRARAADFSEILSIMDHSLAP
jgi:serine/threonine protein kinase